MSTCAFKFDKILSTSRSCPSETICGVVWKYPGTCEMPSDVSREKMTSACTCTKIDLKSNMRVSLLRFILVVVTLHHKNEFVLRCHEFLCQSYLNIVYKNDHNLYYLDKYLCSRRCSSTSALMISLLVPSTDSKESLFDRSTGISIVAMRPFKAVCVC